MAERIGVSCWLEVRAVLAESGALSVAAECLRKRGFSAAEFRQAPREEIARALTAAEDWLEDRRQGSRVAEWRAVVRAARRRAEG